LKGSSEGSTKGRMEVQKEVLRYSAWYVWKFKGKYNRRDGSIQLYLKGS